MSLNNLHSFRENPIKLETTKSVELLVQEQFLVNLSSVREILGVKGLYHYSVKVAKLAISELL